MSVSHPFSCPHPHRFLSEGHRSNERRTRIVMGLTLVTMVVEIVSGTVFRSMALLADGWHMASHASALGIAAFAFYLSRTHEDDDRFTFGTGKIGDLAAYSSALLLALIALYMAYESIQRMISPVSIQFNEAIIVAVIGLAVNLSSAAILKEHHDHEEEESHGNHARHQDHNLRAAYLHVVADALTSILAIGALSIGKLWGWVFLDPAMGIVGAVVISRWSYGLLRDSSHVLLDYDRHGEVASEIRGILNREENISVDDLHVWRLGPGHYSAAIAVTCRAPITPEHLKERLCSICGLSHVTIEVDVAGGKDTDERQRAVQG